MAGLSKKTVEDVEVKGKRVLVRCDFNVPMKDGVITDDTRIRASLKTITYLQKQGAKIVLCSHLGRPAGTGYEEKFSLKPVAERLSELLQMPVEMARDVVGEDAQKKASSLKDGQILLLENVRFSKDETKNETSYSQALAQLADLYVNDAFGAAHRAHSSTAGVAEYLPAVCGYLLQKEIEMLGNTLQNPARPFVAILGGAKVSDKIGVIDHLLEKVDTFIIGGGMAYTFLKAQGHSVGNSLCEEDKLELAKKMLEKAEQKHIPFLLPVDHITGDRFAVDCHTQTTQGVDIPDGQMGLDIGPRTIQVFSQAIAQAKTIVWNGPMGVFEMPPFAAGTCAVAQAVADTDAVSIIGGGDSAAAVEQLGFADRMTHISTGGGASLEFLEGKTLPGVAALNDR